MHLWHFLRRTGWPSAVIAAFCFLIPMHASDPRAVQVKRINYHGWTNSIVLANPATEVVIVPAIGRVMAFRFVGEEGPLWDDPELYGKSPDPQTTEWGNFGGDKTWPAPQADWGKVTPRAWPPPTAFDSLPVEASVAGSVITLVSPVDSHYGIRTRRRIELDSARPVLRITTTYEKVSGAALTVGVWTITQLRDPVAVFAPVAPDSRFASGYDKQSEGLPLDLRVSEGLLSLRRGPGNGEKVGTDAGALLWVGATTMLLIRSPRVAGATYPDNGSSAEVWTNGDPKAYVELEMLGPLKAMSKGDTLERSNTYTLLRRTTSDARADARKALSATD